jgi:hypothetical protein
MEWNVDIVTMSFGFPKAVDSIAAAMAKVIEERKKKNSEILFFAAANNDGSNSEEMFPASLETVISVRGTDHTGLFLKKFNPEPWPQKKGTPLYGTLGEKVPYDIGEPNFRMSGCSVATPILAGITAMIIQYVNCAANGDRRVFGRLRTKEGVLQVLHHISIDDNNRRYVAPWKFFRMSEKDRLALIRHALAELQPRA